MRGAGEQRDAAGEDAADDLANQDRIGDGERQRKPPTGPPGPETAL